MEVKVVVIILRIFAADTTVITKSKKLFKFGEKEPNYINIKATMETSVKLPTTPDAGHIGKDPFEKIGCFSKTLKRTCLQPAMILFLGVAVVYLYYDVHQMKQHQTISDEAMMHAEMGNPHPLQSVSEYSLHLHSISRASDCIRVEAKGGPMHAFKSLYFICNLIMLHFYISMLQLLYYCFMNFVRNQTPKNVVYHWYEREIVFGMSLFVV